MERYYWNLSSAQARGDACVMCGCAYRGNETKRTPVGRDPATEAEVYACASPCVAKIVAETDRMIQEMREAAGLDEDGADGELGRDGEFGRLLRDLRILVGSEALLAVIQDLPTLRFVLQMTAVHAETAMIRSRKLLARAQEGEE
ncbi:hypothetical protein [Streptomyces atriruber]|uniref:hypothetical protein n=1 Tax=Streptomyces atriruber TaxID=545121 RepID=UPI0006E1480A|nr:hypothetical protein [Streptomyces atriruber]